MSLASRLTVFEPYLEKITDQSHRASLITVLNWVAQTFPELEPRLAWNQPMFTAHGTFIIGFSLAKAHFNIALEKVTLDRFADQITAAGDHVTKMLWQVNFDQPVNYPLLNQAITYNLTTKAETTTFWR
ncbi:iron chaperone [Lactiplantibacillus garii]|uniref:Iron chaperone n=1 Tax=Lactiplantibacillus garii TaxID=2306423 RepID=A0A426D8G6_9LACO|nr:DUF1801 domain-containing protein [Lactiplantibacillus garii]RRK10857.1 iron chaperone [Lactiplantibacillus garii]